MFSEIIINVHPFETRVAILEDNKLVELFVEKKEQQNIVGNIYKGRVQDVLPGMGAAFINIGIQRTAFLHYSDIVTDFLDMADENFTPPKQMERDSSKIGKYLHPGQEIVVQVQKGPIGKKGARLTGQISVPGKYLVFFPNKDKIAVSRKIFSGQEKNRIKSILTKVKHKDVGLIVRTEAEGNSEEDLTNEYNGLNKTWRHIERQIKYASPPVCIFDENDLVNKLLRDLFRSDINRMVVDDGELYRRMKHELKDSAPELSERVELYREDSPIFDAYGIEKEIQSIFNARVPLPSGGNIVIEQTEALCAIDINTGSYTGRRNYEDTIRKTNLEAAVEVARQIRLRDLSGIMVVDFIDMNRESARNEVIDTLRRHLKRDRAKSKVYPFGPLGLVELSRKRTRPSLLLTYSEHCPCCFGTGKVLSRDSVAMMIYRWCSRVEYFIRHRKLRIVVHPHVKEFLDENPDYLGSIDNEFTIEADEDIHFDQFKVFDLVDGQDITERYKA